MKALIILFVSIHICLISCNQPSQEAESNTTTTQTSTSSEIPQETLDQIKQQIDSIEKLIPVLEALGQDVTQLKASLEKLKESYVSKGGKL